MTKGILVFTFDDNNKSNELAAKTLHDLDIQGVFLLNAGSDLKEQIEMLNKYNQIIGNHTRSHQLMENFTEEQFKTEVEDFNKELEELAGHKIEWFSYPYSNRPTSGALRQKLIDMFPHRLRGSMEDLATCENVTRDHLRIPVGGYSVEWIEKYLQDNTCILQMHGITKDNEWDVDQEYWNKLIDLWKRSQ